MDIKRMNGSVNDLLDQEKPIDNSLKNELDARIAEELEERVEFGCWGTNCSVCNDKT